MADEYIIKGDPDTAPIIPTPSSGGGHTIIDENDGSMTQRDGLQFTGNVEVTDNAQGNKTVVEIKGTTDHVYATLADAEADIANIKEGETVWTLEEGGTIVTRVEHLETNVANIEDDIDEINDSLSNKCVYKDYSLETTNGAIGSVPCPSGVTFTDYHLPVLQIVYNSGSYWMSTLTVQQATNNTFHVYVRRGTELPPNGTLIAFIAYFLHR